jgi:PPK2 family polyphosphate:nucleotide phosphotransferase
MIESSCLVPPGKKLSLAKRDPRDAGEVKSKPRAIEVAKENLARMDQLQEVLYAEGKRALLVVLQAMDAGGKDGTIEFVFSGINPQGCQVTSFKVPTSAELDHDYLWRVHHRVPARGLIGIFNRSHYEDVLITRVKGLIDDPTCTRRYRHIVEFERMLVEEGTTIVKFFLHVSKDEQKERLIARQQDPAKWWKFNPADLDTRRDWDAYMTAYERMLAATSTPHAPWYVVPADRKWYRNYVVSDIIRRTLEAMNPQLPGVEVDPRAYEIV